MKAIAASLLAVLLPVVLAAAEPKTPTAKKMYLPLKGNVVAITPALLTLKGGEGKPDRRFHITTSTIFLRGSDKVLIEEVRLSQYVTGSFVRSPEGIDTLNKLQLAPKPPAAKKKDATKETKQAAN